MGLVVSVVMARTLGPNDLGIFHQAQWFAGTISVILSLGFMTAVTKFTAQLKGEGRTYEMKCVIRFVYRFEMAIGLLATLGLVAFATPIADHYFSKNESLLFTLAFLAITPGLLTGVLSSAVEGAQTFRYLTIHALTITPLSLATKTILLVLDYGLVGLFWANLVFAVVNLSFYHYAVRRESLFDFTLEDKPSGRLTWKKDLLGYMKNMVGIHFVDLVVWSRTENYFLGRYCKAPEIAYYNLAQNLLLRITGILPNLMWKLLLPITSEHHGRDDEIKLGLTYKTALRYAAVISFPIITACYLASYELIVIFYSHDYAEAKNCFQILCFGVAFTSLSQPSAASLYATNRHQFILRFGLVLAVLNVLLNIFWIPTYGAAGAAASYSITTSLGAMGGFVFTYKKLGFPLPIASFLRCGLACLGMGASILWVIGLNVEPFDVFWKVRATLQSLTGHDAEILLGARSIRVFTGLALGTCVYAILIAWIGKPRDEDIRILESLKRYLPSSLIEPLLGWLRRRVKSIPK
jgi:O-antigen/teichoic acid export membrane protein